MGYLTWLHATCMAPRAPCINAPVLGAKPNLRRLLMRTRATDWHLMLCFLPLLAPMVVACAPLTGVLKLAQGLWRTTAAINEAALWACPQI